MVLFTCLLRPRVKGAIVRYKGIELREVNGEWYFEDWALAETHDGKENMPKLKAWMDKAGVVDSHGYIFCLGKVLYGRAHTCAAYYGPWRKAKPVCEVSKQKSNAWFDHARMFWSPSRREYVLTAQPYDVSLDKYQAMERFASEHGLTVEISLEDAWWYPGRTPLIVWRKRE